MLTSVLFGLSAQVLCLWHAVEGHSKASVYQVFRSDTRDPTILQAQGGFLSTAKNLSEASLSQYVLETECVRLNDTCSRQSFLLRTSQNLATEQQRLGNASGYVYDIQATPNFIDLATSLAQSPERELMDETVVLGDILWTQVRSWLTMPQGVSTDVSDRNWTVNPDFDQALGSYSASLYQTQLFISVTPSASDSSEKAVTNFMLECTSALGWRSLFGPSISVLLDQVSRAAEIAASALEDVKMFNAASSGSAARVSRAGADLAMALTIKLAKYLEDMKCRELKPVTTSYKLALGARRSSMKAMQQSEMQFFWEYDGLTQRAKALALEGDAGAIAVAHEADAVADLIVDQSRRALDELGLIQQKQADNQAADPLTLVDVDKIVCVRTLQDCSLAKQRELDAIARDMGYMEETVHILSQAAARIKQRAEEVMRIALLNLNDGEVKGHEKTADVERGLSARVTKYMAVESVTPVLNEIHKTIVSVKKVQFLSLAEPKVLCELMTLVVDFGLELLASAPGPLAAPWQILIWARRGYRFYHVTSMLAMAIKVGGVGDDLVRLSSQVAQLKVTAADMLKRIDRPPPRTAALRASMKENSTTTFFGVFRSLSSQRAGSNWRFELEVTSGLQVGSSRGPHQAYDTEKIGVNSTKHTLRRVEQMLHAAKGEVNLEHRNGIVDAALEAFDEVLAGGRVRDKTLLDMLDAEMRAGRIQAPDKLQPSAIEEQVAGVVNAIQAEKLRPVVVEEDEYHYSYVINGRR